MSALVTELTILRKATGILSKRIVLGEDGRPKADGSACRLTVGKARRHRMNGAKPADALGSLLDGMPSDTALALGRMDKGIDAEAVVVTAKRKGEMGEGGRPVIARTLDHFSWSDGPGWVLLDIDRKGMTANVAARIETSGGFEAALRSLIPGYDGAARVTRASTSSGVLNAETGERYADSGGLHVYVLLAKQSDAKRFLETLHQRAWLAGLGWFLVGTAGQLLERGIVDKSVASPERLVFEGAPVVEPPLAQDASRRKAVASDGTLPLDSAAATPDLTAEEADAYRRLTMAAQAALKPAAKAEQQRWLAREGAKLGPDGERVLKNALAKRTLTGALILHFDDEELGSVTVDEVMADPARFADETLADPLDGVEYGLGKAKLFVNEDGALVVNSFAHGGRTFRLLHSAASAKAVLEQAGADAARLYVAVLFAADVTAAEEEQLLELVRRLTGIGKRPLRADLKRAKGEAKRERAQERAEAVAERDRRVVRRAPLPDEERAPVVVDIESVLRAERPPAVFQNVLGEVVRAAHHRSALLHLVTGDTAAGGAHADMFAPAPPGPLIMPYSTDSIREVVERRVRYMQPGGEDAPPRAVSLPEPFLRALLTPRPDCTLPLLTAVSDVPVVLPNGRMIVAGGYHADSGIYFTCAEEEARALVPDDLGGEAVRDAYLFLAEELFADVAFHDRLLGTAALVALLLTGISHPILPEKPLFLINAPQRGSGKTTTVNLVTRSLTRRSAAACAWSVNEEERRKALFAVAREGHGILLVDNIPRGTVIRDATIERFSTSAEVRDRVLGESRTEAVRSPVIVLTGNALQLGGDGASRTLQIELTADRPDPENREFRHPDIMAWVDRNRVAIIRACMTILMGNPVLRDRDAEIETRFKAWYVLVGSAVEHAANLAGMPAKMVGIIRAGEAADDTVAPLQDLLALLLRVFPDRRFTVNELTKCLIAGEAAEQDSLNAQLLDTFNSLRRAPLRVITPKTVGPTLTQNVKGVPIDDGTGDIWIVQPEQRVSNKDQVAWTMTCNSQTRGSF
jgi:hypothetical protein